MCQAWHRTEEVKVLCQVFAEPKARIRQGRHREVGSEGSLIPKLRGDEQEPDMRCGPSGTSWHGTAKSSFCDGVGFINLALMQGKFCVLPWEICSVFGGSRTEGGAIPPDHRAEVSRGHSRGVSLEGPNGAPLRPG